MNMFHHTIPGGGVSLRSRHRGAHDTPKVNVTSRSVYVDQGMVERKGEGGWGFARARARAPFYRRARKRRAAYAAAGISTSTFLPVRFSYTSRILSDVSDWKKPVPLSEPGASACLSIACVSSP